jgi:GTP-sensing pleiotropic transcriptional regulator CodY
MIYVKVKLNEGIKMVNGKLKIVGNSFTDKLENVNVKDLFDGAEVGDSFLLELVEMTEEEFSFLKEFTGF